jgi:flagellar hook-basal body complex protein FliE
VIRSINQQQNIAADMMTAVDTGQSDDVVGAMVASQKASLSFSMLLQARNKVLSGIDDVMRMSL